MRKILEIPPINENDIDKVSKVIDIIENNLLHHVRSGCESYCRQNIIS